MRIFAIAVAFFLSGCATEGLNRAATLGDSGAKAASAAQDSYAAANAAVLRLNTTRCVSRVLATNSANCPTDPGDALLKLSGLLNSRATLSAQLSKGHAAFAAEARRAPADLKPVIEQTAALADSLSTLLKTDFPAQAAGKLKTYAGPLTELFKIADEAQRLEKLKTASEALEAASEILAAAYEVEAEVLASVSRARAANNDSAIQALADANLLDRGAVAADAREKLGLPLRPYAAGDAAWAAPKATPFIIWMARQEEAAKVARLEAANRATAAALHQLASAHQQFRAKRAFTLSDVDTLSARITQILGGK